MRISFSDVQRNVSEIANLQEYTIDVLYELMAAYGRSESSITKLRNGVLNQAEDKETTVLQRGVIYFKVVSDFNSLPAEVEKLEQDPLTQRYNPRFLIATDLKTFAARDTKKGNTLEIAWADIDRNVDFFYGWTGDEVTDEKTEAVADRRAAGKMKELYQEIEKVNAEKFKDSDKNFRHQLNVFFTRLLFCFFAEDTKVFSREVDSLFTNSIRDFTQTDGSDLDEFLGTLFESLDEEDKSAYTSPYSKFPYVNGKLFDKKKGIEIPKFNAQARKLILDCGALSWAEINPDIFGSMFQGIVDEEYRSTHGMHYTSVPNIMKTIEPLFLDELREEFDTYYDNPKKLQKLHDRISKIKIFDPACGSGNFLIIAYKELRKLEHAIIERLFGDEYYAQQLKNKLQSQIELDNFYGIELDDFACEVAVLSLYLAKHQMNVDFEKQFGKEIKLIPLKDNAHIVHGNAARIDWKEVCPNTPTKKIIVHEQQNQLFVAEGSISQLPTEEEWDEIYIIGNPPYLGSRNQEDSHRGDMEFVFGGNIDGFKVLDYISIWFFKGFEYMRGTDTKLSFVSTNSVFQGDQVSILWPNILSENIEINYAYQSFKWTNNATKNAGVTVVVVSLRNSSNDQKKLFFDGISHEAKHINAYLVASDDFYLTRRSSPLSKLPPMVYGNEPRENGNLLIDESEYKNIQKNHPDLLPVIKKVTGSQEYINDIKRYCFWLSNVDDSFLKNSYIKARLNLVKGYRVTSKRTDTQKMSNEPHIFTSITYKDAKAILVPIISSERREYIPLGFLDGSYIILNSAQVIYDPELWVFAILNSKMHMSWVRSVAGRLKTDMRYSSAIVYNNFPLSQLTNDQKNELNNSAREVLLARENHTEKTLAEMYDPDKMPDDLRVAHHQNDLLVDRLYRQKPYTNDEERLADLFKLYEEMTGKENEK